MSFKYKNSTEKNKMDEAKAWTRKYFKEASVDKIFLLVDINGMNDNKLISNPIHAPNQEVEDTAIKVPIIRVKIKSIFEGFNIGIKKEEDPMNGV